MTAVDAQVIVIGAGLAGLATARALEARGIDTVILEARQRIGGRVFSHALPNGAIVDMGAQWIGPSQKRINALATEAGATLIKNSTRGRKVSEPKSSLSLVDRFRIAKLGWRLHKEARLTSAETPWSRAQAELLDSMSTEEWLLSVSSPVAACVWGNLASESFCIDSNKISALESLQHFSSMGGLPGLATAETHFIKQGASHLADYLAQGLTIHHNTTVNSVRASSDHVVVESAHHTLRAHQVVIALPPQIGDSLLNAEDAASMGYIEESLCGEVIKTALVYSAAWWRKLGYSGIATSKTGPVSSTYDSTPPDAEYGCLMVHSRRHHANALDGVEQTRIQLIVDHVSQLFGQQAEQPLYSKSINWSQERASLGGYSSVRLPGAWIKRGRTTVSTAGPIHCAGTEFAHEWRSYMEGALASAERASVQVADALKAIR